MDHPPVRVVAGVDVYGADRNVDSVGIGDLIVGAVGPVWVVDIDVTDLTMHPAVLQRCSKVTFAAVVSSSVGHAHDCTARSAAFPHLPSSR